MSWYTRELFPAETRRFDHTQVIMGATNTVDPDDGNAWVCKACRLPIFFTPFTRIEGSDTLVLHNQCADEQLPPKFESHPLHPRADLDLIGNDKYLDDVKYCDRCRSVCGSKLYKCPDDVCDFTIDLTCALPISVMHRSHAHRLTATRGASCSFICNACGTQHRPPLGLEKREAAGATWDLSYVCGICDFWIHPECAVLPNAIVADKCHKHPLLLTYAFRDTSSGMITGIPIIVCAICDGKSNDGIGWYDCFHCGYSAHVKCVMGSDPRDNLNQVLLKDAEIPGLLRLPMADEHQVLMARIMKMMITSTTATTDDTTGASTSGGSKDMNKVHEHPLKLHNDNGDDYDDIARVCNDKDIARVCNACVRLVPPSSPFYSCSRKNELSSCRDFILHDCCANLPSKLVSTGYFSERCKGHSLSLVGTKKPFDFFKTSFLQVSSDYETYQSNGFSYFCKTCHVVHDVMSALMPVLITHDAHSSSHFLRKTRRQDAVCSFCAMDIYTEDIGYECNNGCNFFLHAECAILPATVTHEFDRHPLNLIRPSEEAEDKNEEKEDGEIPFCEICEENIDNDGCCYYGCNECEQFFHTDCIPYFDILSKIKFGFTVRVTCHDCPLACVRATSVHGYCCGHCKDVIRESEKIALECEECCFRMHEKCAKKLLSKNN